jgi:hypothetical protein
MRSLDAAQAKRFVPAAADSPKPAAALYLRKSLRLNVDLVVFIISPPASFANVQVSLFAQPVALRSGYYFASGSGRNCT